jgi:hypothetical protein
MKTMSAPRDLRHAVPAGDRLLLELVRGCLSHPSCARLLHWLHAHPTTMTTAADLGSVLKLSVIDTRTALERLDGRGFLRRVSAGGLVFYGLAEDRRVRGLLSRFENWCDDQSERWAVWRDVVE